MVTVYDSRCIVELIIQCTLTTYSLDFTMQSHTLFISFHELVNYQALKQTTV